MINILSTTAAVTAAEQFWAALAIKFSVLGSPFGRALSVENLNNSRNPMFPQIFCTPNLPPQNDHFSREKPHGC